MTTANFVNARGGPHTSKINLGRLQDISLREEWDHDVTTGVHYRRAELTFEHGMVSWSEETLRDIVLQGQQAIVAGPGRTWHADCSGARAFIGDEERFA